VLAVLAYLLLVGVAAPADARRPIVATRVLRVILLSMKFKLFIGTVAIRDARPRRRGWTVDGCGGHAPRSRLALYLWRDPRRYERPKTGTVTFLFTDLEGSTGTGAPAQDVERRLVEHRG
jgi:hypothetical protein